MKIRTRILYRLILNLLLIGLPALALGQTVVDTARADSTRFTRRIPVRFGDRTAFVLMAGVEEMTLEERAEAINRRLARARARNASTLERRVVAPDSSRWEIRLGETLVAIVGSDDAATAALSADSLSAVWLAGLREAVEAEQRTRTIRNVAFKITVGLLFPVLLWVAFVVLGRLWRWTERYIADLQRRWHGGIYIRGFELLRPGTVAAFLPPVFRFMKGTVYVAVLYVAIVLFFSFFPQTRPLGNRMIEAVLAPVLRLGRSTLDFVPLITAAVVVTLMVRFALRIIDFILDRIDQGIAPISARGHRLLYALKHVIHPLIVAVAALFILSYTPGQGPTLVEYATIGLIGLIIIGFWKPFENVVADIILSYILPFQEGDRVCLDNITGVVITQSAFFVRLRDDQGRTHFIPKRILLDTDFTIEGRQPDTAPVLVSIQADLSRPVKDVERMCYSAVQKTEGLEDSATVRVSHLDLKDNCVVYNITGRVRIRQHADAVQAALYRNILDALQHDQHQHDRQDEPQK